ncbi:MAG: hypothetical protein M0R77_02510 [Gammaproteobacteria bacterium]|nr:hypothetical protein [Gammaproteobacteria bacterium]
MNLDDINFSDKHYSMLKKDLKESYFVDMTFFESLPIPLLEKLLIRTGEMRSKIFLESLVIGNISSPISLLNEALRVYLKEIYPQKKVKFKEDLEYKIDPNNGAAISGDGTNRPDLYWREDQYNLEKMLTQRLQNPNSTPEDYIKFDPRDANPIDAPSNENNIYVSVLNPDKINGLDGDVLKISNPSDQESIAPVNAASKPGAMPVPAPAEQEIEPSDTSIYTIGDDQEEEQEILNIPGVNINFNIGNLKEGEMSKIEKMTKLTESVMLEEAELQRAEIVLATKDIVSRLQKQIEDISSMATDDVLPLVDGMKENFGAPTANGFARKAEDALQKASDSVQELRDLFDSYARALEKHIGDGSTPNDLSLDDEVPAPIAPIAPDGEESAEAEDYEKKDPEEALMGESIVIGGKTVKLDESQMAAIKFAKKYNESPMPMYLLSESEKKQLKIAAKILKGGK